MMLSMICGGRELPFEVSDRNVLWELRPNDLPPVEDDVAAIGEALDNPIGSPRLDELVGGGMRVVILADDFTRPTPRKRLLPVMLDQLNGAGVPDQDISIIIAVGAHRYMSDREIRESFGEEVVSRVEVINHRWMDPEELVDLGTTRNGTPVTINRRAYEADLLIGLGSIVPHCFAGFSGGAKIVQPGISGSVTTAATHFLICQEEDQVLRFAGTMRNRVMEEMREVARRAGLRFIVNVVFNSRKELVKVVAGDPVKAHEAGMEVSRRIFVREIPARADIVIADAHPAETDMWQATKPLSYARRTVKEGGTIIFVIAAPDGISPTHPFLEERGRMSFSEIREMMRRGEVEDRVAGSILMVIKKGTEGVNTITISDGLTEEMKDRMGMEHADSIQEALDRALRQHGKDATVGIIHHGGDVLAVLKEEE